VAVKDTVGAGDAFNGGSMMGLTHRADPQTVLFRPLASAA
jgi:sugar/nucleoside kinase (ribokinase family)